MKRSVYVRLCRNETGNRNKKVYCKRLRKIVLFFFLQLYVKFHLLRFYEQV